MNSSNFKRSLDEDEDILLEDEELLSLVDTYVASKQQQPNTSSTSPKSGHNGPPLKKHLVSNEKTPASTGSLSDFRCVSELFSTVSDDNENKVIRFYWIDAFTQQSVETDTVYLFGKILDSKTQKYISASLCVRNVCRRIFLLPREYFRDDATRKVTMQDVNSEFTESLTKKLNIGEFSSRKVVKKYAFELAGIPTEAEYLEVLYSANFQPLPQNYHSGNTYCHTFGVNASILENLILDLNLSGPQWLVVKNPTITKVPVTWCQIELNVNSQSQICVEAENKTPAPEFTVLSLNFKTYTNTETKQNEIIAISGSVNRCYKFEQNAVTSNDYSHFCIITCPSQKKFPIDFNESALDGYKGKVAISSAKDEKELFNKFLTLFHQIDADIVVGHNLVNFDYNHLLSRCAHHNIPCSSWTKLGRLNLKQFPNCETNPPQHLLAGRLICDIKILARELIRAESFDLKELSSRILNQKRDDISQAKLPRYYASSAKLIQLIEMMAKDNDLIFGIVHELNCLPLAKEITNTVGNLLSRTLLGGQSARNEYLLLHAFDSKGYIVPDKVYRLAVQQEPLIDETVEQGDGEEDEKPKYRYAQQDQSSYVGGLVLEPKTGFYDDYILVMDFNSLYPSIVQEYDICFTTIDPKNCPEDKALVSSKSMQGVLPAQICKLVDARREVKKQLCDPNLTSEEKTQLDIKQKAMKLVANSIYGCLGYTYSRFYAKHLAALVTGKGREILCDSKELVEQIGYEVIYGDTDSLMIRTNCKNFEEVQETGNQIQAKINCKYNLLEIGIDAVFQCMLLLKKKKYAGLTVSKASNGELLYHKEIKGLEIVRRDWSSLVRNTANAVLDRILALPDDDGDRRSMKQIVAEIREGLEKLVGALRSGEFGVGDFVINKALTKDPEEYSSKAMAHVVAALRYNQTDIGKPLRSGDTVPFVICSDGTHKSVTQRAYHIDDARQKIESGELEVDTDYYLSQQLLPVLTRLCEPIKGANIAQFLGIHSGGKRARK